MFVFVVGSGRNGATLVTELLARHPDVGFVSNLQDKITAGTLPPRWNGRLYRAGGPRDPKLMPTGSGQRLLDRGRARVRPSEAFEILSRQVSPVMAKSSHDLTAEDASPWLAGRLQRFFEGQLEAQRVPFLAHHMSGWPRTGLLHAVFPDAKFVHVVRDGRAVANSYLQMHWWDGYTGPEGWRAGPLPEAYRKEWEAADRSFTVLAGINWKIYMDAYDAAKPLVPAGQWLDVRLEDLVADPRPQTARVMDFAGLDWTSEFERGFARHEFHESRIQSFRKDLRADQVAALDAVLADHLRRWGYPVDADAPTSAPAPAPASETEPSAPSASSPKPVA